MIAKSLDCLKIDPFRFSFGNTVKLIVGNSALVRETVEAYAPFFHQFGDSYPDHFCRNCDYRTDYILKLSDYNEGMYKI